MLLGEQQQNREFLNSGYIIFKAENANSLAHIRATVRETAKCLDLDQIEIHPAKLNALKLRVMEALNTPVMRSEYFALAQEHLYALVGSEISMQKKFNLNVQLPGDDRNLLALHTDTWTGDSPYQVVVWLPLVDCYRTKSMFLQTPQGEKYLDVKYGEVLIFNSTLPHGNRVNEEETTRWTINCRFKNVWTPYGVKGPGEHFEPITLRAASKIGMSYKHPA